MADIDNTSGTIIRAACVLIENKRICLVKQEVTETRHWALPGGKVEVGESLSECITREFEEETGLEVGVVELLYMTDRIVSDPFSHIIHMSFLVERQEGDELPPEWKHADPHPSASSDSIRDVRMVPVNELEEYGFSPTFRELAEKNFPGRGGYKGSFFLFYKEK